MYLLYDIYISWATKYLFHSYWNITVIVSGQKGIFIDADIRYVMP